MTHFKPLTLTLSALVLLLSVAGQATVLALVPPAIAGPRGLSLIELKMTGDEFVMIQNNTVGPIDVSNYWLTSFNNTNPLAAGVSSSSQQLPAVTLQAKQTLLLSAAPMQTCGASVAGKLAVSLTDAGGFVQLSNSSLGQNGGLQQSSGDYVSWSSSAIGVIPSVPSSTKAPRAAYYRYAKGDSYAWQQADLDTTDGCQLNIVVAGVSNSSSAVTPLTLTATSPPATILGTVTSGDGDSIAVLPAADIGLSAPQISELLPNPVGTGNDGSEEFIELYNPNTKPFDLTGFTLQTGLKTFKSYTFPEGTMLEPGSFKAFSAADTKLSLSNTTSQVALLDPFENVISSSDIYKNAKDGIGWATAKGAWYWTTKLTPGAANVIQQPASKKKAATAKKTTKKRAVINRSATAVNATGAPNANGIEGEEQATIVHYRILALVGAAALLYGVYEYRRDLIHRLRQFGAKLGIGRAARSDAARPGTD